VDYKDYCGIGRMTVIANPNAPTGMEISLVEIEEILKSNPDNIVIIDEAYIDFGGTSCVDLIKKYDNLLVVQTFSKSRSMAGARLGFAIADAGIIEDLEKIKYSTNPYNIKRLTLVAGEAAVDSNDYYVENAKKIAETREMTTARLREMNFTVLDSKANFIFAKSNSISGKVIYEELKKKGVWIFGTAAEGSIPMYKADLTGGTAIVIGSEGDGMSRLVRQSCDVTVHIPMKGRISSLNASTAASILLYEAVRQRLG
jgi:histidinol-phosphate aminotransferase